jgi:hypothetical protein
VAATGTAVRLDGCHCFCHRRTFEDETPHDMDGSARRVVSSTSDGIDAES